MTTKLTDKGREFMKGELSDVQIQAEELVWELDGGWLVVKR